MRRHTREQVPRGYLALVPIRSFDGLTRLAGRVSLDDRRVLSRALASRVVDAAHLGGFTPIVVTQDATVRQWAADRQARSFPEPTPGGLSRAAAAAVEAADGDPWIVVHADLPVVTAADFSFARRALDQGIVLAPSHDGGTSLIGSAEPSFPFQYGPASFHRHLASVRGQASVLIRRGLALDLDRPWDLATLRRLSRGLFEVPPLPHDAAKS